MFFYPNSSHLYLILRFLILKQLGVDVIDGCLFAETTPNKMMWGDNEDSN